MKDEILKALFSYSPKFFKRLFDKYVNKKDYKQDVKKIGSSQNLLDELVTDYDGLYYYVKDLHDMEELRKEKLPFFEKMVKHLNATDRIPDHMRVDERGELVLKEANAADLPKPNVDTVIDIYQDIDNAKMRRKRFLFNAKINVLNYCRLFYYCSNIVQRLNPLNYLSVIRIYFRNYPLRILIACSLFCTFITYEKQNPKGIFFLLLFLFFVFVDKIYQFICNLLVCSSNTCNCDKNE